MREGPRRTSGELGEGGVGGKFTHTEIVCKNVEELRNSRGGTSGIYVRAARLCMNEAKAGAGRGDKGEFA